MRAQLIHGWDHATSVSLGADRSNPGMPPAMGSATAVKNTYFGQVHFAKARKSRSG